MSGTQTQIAGERYQAVVPDTLDLAERASIAINALAGRFSPDFDYENYEISVIYARPPFMQFRHGAFFLNAKLAESFPMMRVMSGSAQDLDVEQRFMERMVSLIGDDGLFYCPNTTPWRRAGRGYEGIEEDYSNVMMDGRMMLSMMAWYQRDRDPVWLDRIKKMADGLARVAVYKDDYAFYPEGRVVFEYSHPRSGWKDTTEPGWDGAEGGATTYNSAQVRALSRWYAMSGDKAALDLAGKLVNFLMKPRFWGAGSGVATGLAREAVMDLQGKWSGWRVLESGVDAPWSLNGSLSHVNGREILLRALFEYAIVVNDQSLKELVRDGYEFLRRMGIPRIGWIRACSGRCGCWSGRLVAILIKLCDAGFDYWEDVDQVVRNELVEQQLLRRDFLEAMSEAGPEHRLDPPLETDDRVIERTLGALAHYGDDPAMLRPPSTYWYSSASCCLQAGTQGLYYAWEAAVRCTDGSARINLLLNRASPWLDVDSYLPYEGKVVVTNKTANRLSLRVPRWADRTAVRCQVNDSLVTPHWLGQYVILDGLRPRDVVTVTFPVVEETAKYSSQGTRSPEPTDYTLHFKGNDLVDISPRKQGVGYPVYLRDSYRQDHAPKKSVTRFVSSASLGPL